jgi:integrase
VGEVVNAPAQVDQQGTGVGVERGGPADPPAPLVFGQLNAFLQAVRAHRWAPELQATAVIFTTDYPKRSEQSPRALAEHVMAQVEPPDNLDRFDNPAYRLVTLVLIRCGLRVTDALGLGRDCLVSDADHAPYLRYFNHKMRREALVPIDNDLHQQIVEQQQRVDPAPLLVPRATKNPDGTAPPPAPPTGERSTGGWRAARSPTSTGTQST